MQKKLFRLRLAALLFVIIELLAVGFACVCYYNNFFNFNEFISNELLFGILSLLIFFTSLILMISLTVFTVLKRKTDLKAAELIGQDINEAYHFGMIGLVVVDEENTVLWVNDLFKERQIDILNTNVVEWQPGIQELIDSGINHTIKLLINTRSYEVKYLKDAGLYIFKDVTDFDTVSDYSKRQATVVGQLMIDNYSDLSESSDENGDTITRIKSVIFEYAKEHNALLRRIRNDSYFLLCNNESLQNMEKDKFSILEKVRKIGEKEPIPPTLSIGIAHGFPDVLKLNDMASSAIDIAMSRGGDQVVVSQYGQDIVFYGGNTLAQENRNKVKVRVMSDSVISLIKNSSNVFIMGHEMPDMDSLGSCLGMKAICDYCGKESKVIVDMKNIERKTKAAILSSFTKEESAEIFATESQAMSTLKTNTLVIVCDVHRTSMTQSRKIVEKATKVMVIDHHRRSEEFIESPVFAHIDSSASSASELVTELIRYSSTNPRIEIKPAFATIMLSGIFLDSNYFKSTNCGIRSFEASMILKEYGADNAKADDFLKDEFEEYTLITRIISTLKTPKYGVVYCVADDDDIIDIATLAKAANQCMQMKGVNACFVVGRTGVDEVRISARSDGSMNVQLIAEKLNGGGHFTMAGCSFKKLTVAQVEDKLLSVLNDYSQDMSSFKDKE